MADDDGAGPPKKKQNMFIFVVINLIQEKKTIKIILIVELISKLSLIWAFLPNRFYFLGHSNFYM